VSIIFFFERDFFLGIFFFSLKIRFLCGFSVFSSWMFLFSFNLLQRERFRMWVLAFMRSS